MLLAVDTNVLARAMIDDGSRQVAIARQCLLDNTYYVADTVLLETEWLLRSVFSVERVEVNRLFSDLVASDNATFRDREKVALAVLAHRAGVDFADALHLVSADNCTDFVTFDADLIKNAGVIPTGMMVRNP
jgi:predicted nucleic-acid-binding protein